MRPDPLPFRRLFITRSNKNLNLAGAEWLAFKDMNSFSTKNLGLTHPGNVLAALFLLTYPVMTLAVHGGASALFLAATFISLCILVAPGNVLGATATQPDRTLNAMCIAFAAPLAATLASEWSHGRMVFPLLDAPSRFLAAVPLVLVLRRLSPRTLRWADLSFAIGAIASLLILVFAGHNVGEDRSASSFLNAIHFGDIALVLGALSVLSLNWWQKDRLGVRVIKVVGLFAGLGASLLTGSRGGWLALPVIVALVIYVRGRGKSHRWQLLLLAAAVLAVVGVYMSSAGVRDRIHEIWSDMAQYTQGHKDTSVGIRIQLYDAAFTLMPGHLVFGLGPNGFADSMQALVDAGKLTPLAGQLGRGETHNQMLAYIANYGIIGGLAGIAIYLMPCLLFWKHLNAPSAPMRRAALLGLTFVVSFWVFGLTVETFDLKMTASFYAAVTAILAGIASCREEPNGQANEQSSVTR